MISGIDFHGGRFTVLFLTLVAIIVASHESPTTANTILKAKHGPGGVDLVPVTHSHSDSTRAQTQVIKIWPDLAPGTEGAVDKEKSDEDGEITDVYQPDLTVYLPEHQAGLSPAIVVFPGGGYRKLCMEKEGHKVARWLNKNGIAAFVLKYRLNRVDALRDAQRAIGLIRKDARKHQIDDNRIGVIGFSAGAHLACNLVVNHQNHESYDAIDAISSRPDFWIGVYGGCRVMYGADGKLRAHKNLPPAFLVHAGDDSRAPVLRSVELYTDLKQKGVPAELHVYERGEHGFALEEDRGSATTSTVVSWSRRCIEWLKVRGILQVKRVTPHSP